MFGKGKGDKDKKEAVDLAMYEKMITELLASHGLDPEKCRHRPKTLWSAYRGSALIYTEIFKVNDIDYIEISCPIMKMPSSNLLPFYRKLLESNYKLIGVKFFLINDWLYLSENRELKGLSMDELKAMEDRVSSFADQYDDLLVQEFKTQAACGKT
jgi:hypothetical protein